MTRHGAQFGPDITFLGVRRCDLDAPETYADAAAHGFDLMLSGHTHVGQLCLPGGIPIKLEAVLPRAMGNGAWQYEALAGYTSVGVGTSLLPVRLNCPPEVTLHRLRRAG